MATQRKELVSLPDASIGMNEAVLKQLTVMFSRIAIQGLFIDYSKVSFFSPDFLKVRSWLADLGVLFDLDIQKLKSATAPAYARIYDLILEDANLVTKPAYGMSVQEMNEARTDEAKAAELRKLGAETGKRFEDGSLDPVKMTEIGLRVTTNMCRMLTSQLRDVENVEASPVLAAELSAFEQDDPRLTKYDVVRVGIGALPVPIDSVPWQQLIDFRSDPETANSFLLINEWMTEVARASFTPSQVEESLEYLLNRFRSNLETHGINTTTKELYAYVVTTPEFAETLAGVGLDWGTRAQFSIDRCNLGLLECESTTAGSVLGFLLPIGLDFSAEVKQPT